MKLSKINKKFIYLISPIKIKNNNFYVELVKIFKLKKVAFFQLRLKKESKKIEIDQELEKLLTSLPNYAKRELSSYIYELIGKDHALEDTREVKYLIGLLCTGSKLSFPKAFLKRLRKKLIRK